MSDEKRLIIADFQKTESKNDVRETLEEVLKMSEQFEAVAILGVGKDDQFFISSSSIPIETHSILSHFYSSFVINTFFE